MAVFVCVFIDGRFMNRTSTSKQLCHVRQSCRSTHSSQRVIATCCQPLTNA